MLSQLLALRFNGNMLVSRTVLGPCFVRYYLGFKIHYVCTETFWSRFKRPWTHPTLTASAFYFFAACRNLLTAPLVNHVARNNSNRFPLTDHPFKRNPPHGVWEDSTQVLAGVRVTKDWGHRRQSRPQTFRWKRCCRLAATATAAAAAGLAGAATLRILVLGVDQHQVVVEKLWSWHLLR